MKNFSIKRSYDMLPIAKLVAALILVFSFSYSGLSNEIPIVTFDVNESRDQIKYLPDQWMYSEHILQSMDAETYQGLRPRAANGANLEYVAFRTAVKGTGAFVLQINANENYKTSILFKAFTSANQVLLVNDQGIFNVYEHPRFHQAVGHYHRVQQVNVVGDLTFVKGVNYLILNYKFLPYVRQGKEWVNVGFGHWVGLGHKNLITDVITKEMTNLRIPLGVLFCLAIYSLLIYFSRKGQDRESLLLFVVNISVFMKEFANQSIFASIFGSNFLIQLYGTIVYAMPMLSSVAMIKIVRLSFESKFLKILTNLTIGNCVVSLVVNISPHLFSFFPFLSVVNNLGVLVNFICIAMILTPLSIYYSIRSKKYEITAFAVGISALAIGLVTDLINVINSYHWPWVSMWGAMFFSLILAKNNSKKFADTYAESEKLIVELSVKNKEVAELNLNLEKKVEERTSEVQGLLRYIPQGIFSIGPAGAINPSYSSQLPEILGHNQIAGQTVNDILFKRCNLSEDERDQAWQTVVACIGGDSLNFDANKEKLPTLVIYERGEDEVFLKITWNVEVDANDEIKHILVTLLDSTQEMAAKKELEQKNQDFEVIRQLVEAGPKKSAQFFSTAQLLLDENSKLAVLPELAQEDLKILFVNAHTLKGAARTLQFSSISNMLHHIESTYGKLLKGETLEMNSLDLLTDIQSANQIINRYRQVNHDVLGRSEDYSKVHIDRDFLENNFRIFRFLENSQDLPENIREILHENSNHLVEIIFTDLQNILDDIMTQVPKIAHDLNKEVPHIELSCPSVYMTHSQENLLRNCLLHLLRNSLDHGIESSQERTKIGKPSKGTITIQVTEKNRLLSILMCDDGRGLAISRLRKLGEADGRLDKNASPQEVAELIFHQGVSTAHRVTQISGRGVGMDAVRRYLEAQKGSIYIELAESKDDSCQYYNFSFHMELPVLEMSQEENKQAANL